MENELYHYGRKGMKWYQNIFTKGKEASAARKKRKAEKEAETLEAKKKRIRESRSAEEVYKHAHLYNDKELNEIYQRLNTENNIKNLIPAKVNKGKKFIEGTISLGKNVNALVGEGQKLYSKLSKLFNKSSEDEASSGESREQRPEREKKPKKEKPKKEDEPEYEIIDPPKSPPKGDSKDSKPIIDVDWVDVDTTALARTMTRNVGSRTVNWVKNNPSRIESGENFVNGLLALPAPKDD